MNEIDCLVGSRIRARRYALGISQTELGEAIGVRFQQIQKYETGANRVSASRLWAVAEKLGVDIAYFFEGIRSSAPEATDADGEQAATVDDLAFLSDQDALQMMTLFCRLPITQRNAVLAIVRSMADAPPQQNLRVAT